MKITLFLITLKGYEVFKTLIENNYKHFIDFVIVGRDKNVNDDFADNIIKLCKKNNIVYHERNDDYIIDSNYSIAISWRWLINNKKSKLIVLHDSLLPKYRGFAPLPNALINGEKVIGVTALYATNEYDKGNILAQASTKINYPIKINEAIKKVSKNYIEVILKIFKTISENKPFKETPQDEKEATYSLWRDEDDYLIDWSKDADWIVRFINAVGDPYKGASAYIENKKIRIHEAEEFPDVKIENRTPGKTIFMEDIYPVIVCEEGLIKLTNVDDDENGKSVLPFKKFRTILRNKLY